jgi:hypothetical protein
MEQAYVVTVKVRKLKTVSKGLLEVANKNPGTCAEASEDDVHCAFTVQEIQAAT